MKRYISGVILVLVLTLSGIANAQEGVRRLSLQEAIRLAVEKNLDVRAELFNPAAAEADLQRYLGIYDPLLSLLLEYQNANTVQANTIFSGVAVSRQRSVVFDAGVNQLLPTGGTVGAGFNNSWNKNNFTTRALNEYFESDLTFTITQPLLQNFGRGITNINIDVARFNKEGALEQFRARLLDVVAQVKTQYNLLYSLRQNLESKRSALTLAETVFNNTQAQVKAGVLPAMEILNTRYGVATRQKELIDAERALQDQVDALRNLLQLTDATNIVPVDNPSREEVVVDEAREAGIALAERPDLRQLRVAVKANELQSRVARNQTLPQLDLTASAAFTGLSETYNRDLERVGTGKYPIWIAGLQLTYPLGNNAAENDYIRSKLRVGQAQTQVLGLESAIARDVRAATRAVRSGFLQLDVTARGRAYAEEVLQAYIKRQQVGLSTTKDVLDVLNNLVAAQSLEIQAVTDYNNAIVTLRRTTGELLAREGIFLTGTEADELYRRNR